MGARRDFLNQALLDRRRSVYRGTIQPRCYDENLQLRHTVQQCVNKGLVSTEYPQLECNCKNICCVRRQLLSY